MMFLSFRISAAIIIYVLTICLSGCSTGLTKAGDIIKSRTLVNAPELRGSNLRVGGFLGATAESCACFTVCDVNTGKCSKCTCDPKGCGTCD